MRGIVIKHKSVLSIFAVAIFFIAMLPSTVSSAGQDSRLLEITIEDSKIATVEWRIPYPGEASVYLPVAYQVLKDNIADVEVGNEQLFLQDVQNIRIAEDGEALVITFSLIGNYSDGFVTGKYQDLRELGEYAPDGVDVLKIKIPDDKYFSSINPGPNEIKGNELTYYNYNWIYPLEINYSNQLTTTQIEEEWRLPIPRTISVEDLSAETLAEIGTLGVPTPISNSDFGINEDSKYTIPGYGSYVGTDTVPGTNGKNAYTIASDYKPELYKEMPGIIPDPTDPNYNISAGYYRVLKGYDPYVGFNAYLIQYIMYWEEQDCSGSSHIYDYEPIFIWVQKIGDKPYRIAYDRWTPTTIHIYDIHRTDLWSGSSGQYDLDDMQWVWTQDKSYYPMGKHLYTADVGDDLWLRDISTSLQNNWNGTHVKLSHANCYNTFDENIDAGDPLEPYPLLPLDDDQLRAWYLNDINPLDTDISDSFYEVFWEGVKPDLYYPESISITLNSATPNGNTLTVDASVSYDHSNYPSPLPLKGLHDDRFEGYFGSTPLPLSSITETSAGRYELNYDISSFYIGDTYTFTLTVNDNLDNLSSTVTDSVDIPGDTTPPTPPTLISPSGTITDSTPTFTWNAATDDLSGIDYYQIQVDNNIDFSSPVIDTTTGSTSYTALSPLGDTTYHWRVRARDNASNWGDNSSSLSFTIDTSTPLPDLTLTSSDITWDSTSSRITATIYNIGEAGASNVRVDFFNGNPSNNDLIGYTTITSITVGNSQDASVTWNNAPGGTNPTVYVVIDSAHLGNGAIQESDETNNIASKSVTVPAKTTEITAITVTPTQPDLESTTNIKATITNNGGKINSARLKFKRAGPDRDFSEIMRTIDFSISTSDTTIEKDFNYSFDPVDTGQNFILAELWNGNKGVIVSTLEKEVYVLDRAYELRISAFTTPITPSSTYIKVYWNPKSGQDPLENGVRYHIYGKLASRNGTLPTFGDNLVQNLNNWSWLGHPIFPTSGYECDNCWNVPRSQFDYLPDGMYYFGVIEDSNDNQEMDDPDDRDGISSRSYYMNFHTLAPAIDSPANSSEVSGTVTVYASSKTNGIKDEDITRIVFQKYEDGSWADIYTDNTPEDGFSYTEDMTNVPDMTKRIIRVRAFAMDGTSATSSSITLIVRSDIKSDLVVYPSSISFNPSQPREGDVVNISAQVFNIGSATAYDVKVRFYLGDPQAGGTQIRSEQTITSIDVAGNGISSVNWNSIGGSHDIFVVADPLGDIPETNVSNNKAERNIEVNVPPTIPTSLTPVSGIHGGIVNVACSGSTDLNGDPIYYTILGYYDGTWHDLELNGDGIYNWDVSSIASQTGVDLKCNATDLTDSSAYFNPAGTLEIDTTPPTVENSSSSDVMSGEDETVTVDAYDLNGISTVILRLDSTTDYEMTFASGNTYTVTIPAAELTGGQHGIRYYVNDTAGNVNSGVTDSFEVITPTSFNISLSSGWNLISLPLVQANWSITAVLDSVCNYTVIQTYINGGWKSSTTPAQFGGLTDMDLEHGYWISCENSDTLELNGTLPTSTTINVSTGWNLVGYPSFTTRNITDVLSPINYSVVSAWIDGAWKDSTTPAQFGGLSEMNSSYGYWINANENGSYAVEY